MKFVLLGPLEIRPAGKPVALHGLKQRKVLATLLLNTGRAVPVRSLIDIVWESNPPKTAEKQIRNAVSDIRHLLGGKSPPIRLVTGGYRIDADDHLDTVDFTRKATRARTLAVIDPEAAAAEFRSALALWRGDVLTGMHCPALEPQIAKLRELRLAAFEDYVDLELERGAHRRLVAELADWTRKYPLRERLAGQLILALHRSGATGEATLAYHSFRDRLQKELGIEPSPRLQALHDRIMDSNGRGGDAKPRAASCDLPRDTKFFTGRTLELDKLAESAIVASSAVVISAIDGMAGVGKTALAIHVAHRLSEHFPDAQLFMDMHAHTAGHAPHTPVVALQRLLRTLGIDQERIPHDLDGCAALWRTELARRQVLVVLDNVATVGQINPLLPDAPGSLVILTSRYRLTGLDADSLMLDVLPADDAKRLLIKVIGDDRPLKEPDATREVLELCGHLPLAVHIAGSRLRHLPAWSVRHLAGRLRDHRRRLDELDVDDHSVATAFALSYQQLPEAGKTLFRLLGCIPGADIDSYAASALAGDAPASTEAILENLVDAHLLEQYTPGRYRFHDLLRSYAAKLSLSEDSAVNRRVAVGRLLDHYLAAAAMAMDVLAPTERVHRPKIDEVSIIPVMADYSSALGWLNAERRNLLAAAEYAFTAGHLSHCYRLSGVLWRYFHISGYHYDALTLHETGLRAALTADDARARADTLASRGYTNWWLGRYPQALQDSQEAARVAQRVGDKSLEGRALHAAGLTLTRLGADASARAALEATRDIGIHTNDRVLEGYALRGLGEVHYRLDSYASAVAAYEKAIVIARETRNITIEGYASRALGEIYTRQGENDKGFIHCTRALELARNSGNRNIQARALRTLGEIHRESGRLTLSHDSYSDALRIAEETGSLYEVACAHDGAARTRWLQGNSAAAARHWRKAIGIFEALDVPEADQARRDLAAAFAREDPHDGDAFHG